MKKYLSALFIYTFVVWGFVATDANAQLRTFIADQLNPNYNANDCLITNADGVLSWTSSCGGGGGSGFSTTSADFWAQNDLTLTEISDVDGSPSTNDLLVWDGDSWNNYATTSANLGFVDFSDLHDAVTLRS